MKQTSKSSGTGENPTVNEDRPAGEHCAEEHQLQISQLEKELAERKHEVEILSMRIHQDNEISNLHIEQLEVCTSLCLCVA